MAASGYQATNALIWATIIRSRRASNAVSIRCSAGLAAYHSTISRAPVAKGISAAKSGTMPRILLLSCQFPQPRTIGKERRIVILGSVGVHLAH